MGITYVVSGIITHADTMNTTHMVDINTTQVVKYD